MGLFVICKQCILYPSFKENKNIQRQLAVGQSDFVEKKFHKLSQPKLFCNLKDIGAHIKNNYVRYDFVLHSSFLSIL